ncbi:helicase-related protein [Tepidibacillus marianensis]|uniref:DEAD/DEAH box helicase n=1 Tax=Tepidibacillus marianensis TaxID=3131995 RepID=UPI0030D02C05
MKKCCVYGIRISEQMEWKFSFDLAVDKAYWATQKIEKMIMISPLLSIGTAQALIQCLNRGKKQRGFFAFATWMKKVEDKALDDQLMPCQRKIGIVLSSGIVKLNGDHREMSDLASTYQEWKQKVNPLIQGKQLLVEEIEAIPKQRSDLTPFPFYRMLQYGILLGEVRLSSGVSSPLQTLRPECQRCGSVEKVHIQPCSSCDEPCATCEECIVMGRSKTCTLLIHFDDREMGIDQSGQAVLSMQDRKDFVKVETTVELPQWLQLTEEQSHVANHALSFVRGNQWNELLIWAVTGAGKTEMIFPLVQEGLRQGLRILLASPRKDVIKELTPRFRQVFPDVQIVCLFGGSPERWNHGQLYLATTHQTMRFTDFFDIVIIDEMDAFPYHGDLILHRVVRRALKSDGTGKMIYLTATPSEGWIDRVQHHEIDVVVLPVRYHRRPLPVPELKLTMSFYKLLQQAKAPNIIGEFIERVKKRNGQAFLFVPEVKNVVPWVEKLKKWFPMDQIEGVHASDPFRDEKVEQFRRSEIQFLVTTTIMERGVTVPNVHVMVLGADSQLFDESTLVQIAGRVGRSADYSDGIVWFLAKMKTGGMVKAKQHIERMNRKAGI